MSSLDSITEHERDYPRREALHITIKNTTSKILLENNKVIHIHNRVTYILKYLFCCLKVDVHEVWR